MPFSRRIISIMFKGVVKINKNIYLFNDEVDVHRKFIGGMGYQQAIPLGMSETDHYAIVKMSRERLDSLHSHHLY